MSFVVIAAVVVIEENIRNLGKDHIHVLVKFYTWESYWGSLKLYIDEGDSSEIENEALG